VIRALLSLPETRGLNIDSPAAIPIHRDVILSKKLLRSLYIQAYAEFAMEILWMTGLDGIVVELGSGGGFIKKVIPDAITSDVCGSPLVDMKVDARQMPFKDKSVKAILMLNVLHHIPRPEDFFAEASRCLVPGGRIVMVEPHRSFLSRLVFKYLHHEPYDERAAWDLEGDSRLTSANQAMPWIIFERDRSAYELLYPTLKVVSVRPHTCFRWLLSGGLSFRQMAPDSAHDLLRRLDFRLERFPKLFPLFQTIVLEKQ
jgi:SAM-dependent methyltransferase